MPLQSTRSARSHGKRQRNVSSAGVVTAAINYYRHTMNPANRDPTLAACKNKSQRHPHQSQHWHCMARKTAPWRLEAFEGMDQFFAAGLEKVILPGTGHFLHLERPGEVNAKIVEFLRRP